MVKNATPEPKTKYLIYETEDEGQTLVLRGVEEADSSGDAYRAYFKQDEQAGVAGVFTAISSNAARFRRRNVEATVKTTVEDLEGPAGVSPVAPPEAPEPAEES